MPNSEREIKPAVEKKTCGIIMPIAGSVEYTADHWKDVLNILIEAVQTTEFSAQLVSDDLAMGLIHERIVSNIYSNDIVICDVSSKNPNVMFELGMRLAFDKATIIIKDEITGYSFDTGVMEHLVYPSSLRFNEIVKFKGELAKRIEATYSRSKTEDNYSPFLKSFGKTIKPTSIQKTEVSEGHYIISQIEFLAREIRSLKNMDFNTEYTSLPSSSQSYKIVKNITREVLESYELNEPFSSDAMAIEVQKILSAKHGMHYRRSELMPVVMDVLRDIRS